MNSLGSWIDQTELDRLVAAVGSKSQPRSPSDPPGSTHSGHSPPPPPGKRSGDSSRQHQAGAEDPAPAPAGRFPVAEEVEKFRDKVAAIKNKARSLGVLAPGDPDLSENYSGPARAVRVRVKSPPRARAQQGTVTRGLPPFRSPRGPYRFRFECFGEWVATVTRAETVIVIDARGDIIFERGGGEPWVGTVSALASAGAHASRQLGLPDASPIHLDLPAERKLAVLACPTRFGPLNVGLIVPNPIRAELADAITEAVAAALAKR